MDCPENNIELLIFLPNLNGGGAERAVINLLKHWPESSKYPIKPILVVRQLEGDLLGQLPKKVETLELGTKRSGAIASIATSARLLKIVRERRPRAIISFLSLPSVALVRCLAGPGVKLIASLQNPLVNSEGKPGFITRWALRKADAVWPIAPGIKNELISEFRICEGRISVLPNSVDVAYVVRRSREAVDLESFPQFGKPVVLTACRLVQQKRVDVLLRAAAQVSKELDFNVVILGEGILRKRLEQLAVDLGISEMTHFLGFQENPWKFMARASMFALTSDYEGFGNVIVEAMTCGAAVVSTRAPYGPNYLIEDGISGLLVPCGDVDALAAAMKVLFSSGATRERLVEAGRRRCLDFDISSVSAIFHQLLEEALTRNDPREGSAEEITHKRKQ